MNNKKASRAYEELASRQNYLIVQANDLAKAFGNLKAFEHKVLDYCFSFVTKDSKADDVFRVHSIDIMRHFGLTRNGQNYKRIADAFKTLNENTALYIPDILPDGRRSIIMTQLFSRIRFVEDGLAEFKFSEDAAPLVFELKNNYYSFQLAELAQIRSKYALILMKLWESNRMGNQQTTVIKGDVEDWQGWFLGAERRLTTGAFKQKVLDVGANELETKLNISIELTTFKNGRTVVGYEMLIHDHRNKTKPSKTTDRLPQSDQVDVSEEFVQAMSLWED